MLLEGGRRQAGISADQAVKLLRPDHRVGPCVPLPASYSGQTLGFRKCLLVLPQSLLDPLTFGNIANDVDEVDAVQFDTLEVDFHRVGRSVFSPVQALNGHKP